MLVPLGEDGPVVWPSVGVQFSLSTVGDVAMVGAMRKASASVDVLGIYVFSHGADRPMLAYPSTTARAPAWSPDGTQVAFTEVTGVWPHRTTTVRILNPTRGEVRDVTVVEGDLLGPNYAESLENSLCWSPDGRRLAFTAVSPGGRFHVFTVPAVGGVAAQVTSGDDAYDHAISCF